MDEKVTVIDGLDLDYLIRVAKIAQDEGQALTIMQDTEGGVKISRGGGMWVGPFGRATTTQD